MKLRRGKPSKHTRHGILIKGLKPSYIGTLEKHSFIKESCEDDNFVNFIRFS